MTIKRQRRNSRRCRYIVYCAEHLRVAERKVNSFFQRIGGLFLYDLQEIVRRFISQLMRILVDISAFICERIHKVFDFVVVADDSDVEKGGTA